MDRTSHASFVPHRLALVGAGRHPDQEHRLIVEMTAKGTYAAINLATADLDGVFERLQAGGAPGGPGNPLYPSRARRRSVTATRSPTTRRPAERSSGSRSGAPGYVVHRVWAVVERRSEHEANAEGEANAQEMTTTRTSQTQSNQRG
jgi:hypothetical protein